MKKAYFPCLLFSLFSLLAQAQIERNGKTYYPIPLPGLTELPAQTNLSSEKIGYDVEAQAESIEPMPISPLGFPPRDSSNGSAGIIGAIATENPEKSFTSLSLVNDPELYPWRVNVKLFITTSSGGGGQCSGVLIDPYHVLTAGHCVFLHDDGGWASGIEVVPAYENGDEPFGSALATNLYSWTGWTTNENYDWDMGYIRLNRPIGGIVGWHGYGYNDLNSFFTGNTFHNPGYPAESPYNGQFMYYWYGNFDDVYTHLLYHDDISFGGQSGSGSYYINASNDRFVYSALSHGFLDPNNNSVPPTGHCRMNSDKFNSVSSQISSFTPATVDLIPLYVRATPNPVYTGDPLASFEYNLHNYSTAAYVGTTTASVYLSTNNIISTFDLLLGTYTWSNNIGAKGTGNNFINAGSLPAVPHTVITGDYFLGVIVANADANISNNTTSTEDVFPMHVTQRQCYGTTTFNQTSAYFEDGSGVQNYQNGADCRWLMQVPNATEITLNFSSFVTESGWDYVTVYDGADINSPVLGSFSGNSLPPQLVSSGSSMLLRFTTDGSVTYQGWSAYYNAKYCEGATVLTTSSGYVFDNSGINEYGNYSNCKWLIQPPVAASVSLDFYEFNTESGFDYVTVYDGPTTSYPVLGTYAGNTLPPHLVSSGSSMLLHFTTDGSVAYSGWSAYYEAQYCTGTTILTANSGIFSDGSGAGAYGNQSNCKWLIQPPGATGIVLNFPSFNTESGYDFVNVYDGSTIFSPLLGSFAGSSIPPPLTSSGGSMLVQFITDASVVYSGWEGSYSITINNCPPTLQVNNNPITSGTYNADIGITSTGSVNASGNVVFAAGDNISLDGGFTVLQGGQFEAMIEDCAPFAPPPTPKTNHPKEKSNPNPKKLKKQ